MSNAESEMSMRKLAVLLAGCTVGVLVLMVITGIATGATQEKHEHFMFPEAYAVSLLDEAKGLRILMGLDIAFLILYTAFFAAFTKYLRALGRPFVTLAFGAMLATAILDIIEDHHILSAVIRCPTLSVARRALNSTSIGARSTPTSSPSSRPSSPSGPPYKPLNAPPSTRAWSSLASSPYAMAATS